MATIADGDQALAGCVPVSQASSSDATEPAGTWCDVTSELEKACLALPVGRVAMRQGFTLFDSMNAIELMAPKMDTGMQRVDGQSVEQRLEVGILILYGMAAMDD